MYANNTVGVVIPAYNEEGYVGEVIDTIPAFVDRVYVIDDGSTDGTWAEITEHAEAHNAGHPPEAPGFDVKVVPIQHEENRGVGGALKTGYLRALDDRIDVTTVLGGDGQMDPDAMKRYLDPIVAGEADYTKGNRFTRPEDYADMPRFRMVGNVVLSYLTKVASGYWQTMDPQNGYTAISLEALERVDIEEMYEFYGYCNDILVKMNVADVRVADVARSSDFVYEDGWKSHIQYNEYIPRVSAMLLRNFFWRLKAKTLHGKFHPFVALYVLGMGLAGAGVAKLLAGLVGGSGERDGTSPLGLLAAGVVVFLLGAVYDMEESRHLERQFTGEEFDVDGTAAEEEATEATQIAANA